MDPRTHAVRPDLADVRLADRVFAPHYAAHVAHTVHATATLKAARAFDSEILGEVAPGDTFEVLDLVGGDAWGIAAHRGLVGYIDAEALAPGAAAR